MVNKILAYVGIGILGVLIIAGFIFTLNANVVNDSVIDKVNDPVEKNPELEKYRSEDIPEDCRLPVYEDDLDWWQEHLSHHKETLYCLDYYK